MRQKRLRLVFLAVVTILVFPGVPIGQCRTIHVPADYETIMEAVELAIPGDTILLSPGIYSGPLNTGIYIHKKHLTIRSTDGPANCIIDCEGRNYAFYFFYFYPQTVTFEGITFRNGSAELGGALRLDNASVISNCIFENNSACEGAGAVYCGSVLTISNCEFFNNSAGSEVGGGALVSSYVTISGCSFTDNRSSGDGGAFRYGYTYGPLAVSQSHFFNNTADGRGGAIFTTSDSTLIENCVFSGNRADQGGGIDCRDAQLRETLLYGNLANTLGGAVFLSNDTLTIEQSTIVYNVSGLPDGGGVYADESTSLLAKNTILWGNSGDLRILTSPDIRHCNVGDGDLAGMTGNISTAPRFNAPMLGDFSLRSDSSCIDRGEILSGSYQGDAPDIGAIESPFSGPVPLPTPAVVTVGSGEQYETLTEALNEYGFPGSTIHLRSGVYSSELFPITLYGVSLIGQGLPSQIVVKGVSDRCVIVSSFDTESSIANCSIESGGAGGLWVLAGSPLIERCDIRQNTNADLGGGVCCTGASDAAFVDCFIHDNGADSGGGLYIGAASASLSNCSITDNRADNDGGGLYVSADGTGTCERTLISGNRALQKGGGLADYGSSAIVHCNVLLNTAQTGGGLFLGHSSAMTNSIVWMNKDDLSVASGATPGIQNCVIGDGDHAGTNGNFSAPPSFVDFTASDYHLNPVSAAIDRGLDIGESFSGNAPDVGMYESEISGPLPLPSPCSSTIGIGGDYPTILSALNDCNMPDTNLSLLPGNYSPDSGERMPIVLYGVHLSSLSGPDVTEISGDSVRQVIHVSSISPAGLNGLSISHGGSSGITIAEGSLEINNCTIHDNQSLLLYGGGIYSASARLLITDSRIRDNWARLDGGGIFCGGANSSMIDCVVEGNTAEYSGGGLYWTGTAQYFQGCTISQNTAHSGGGLYASAALSMTRCVLAENQSSLDAGGIRAYEARLTHCTIVRNRSTRGCDGVQCRGSSLYPVVNCIFWDQCEDLESSGGNLTVQGCDMGQKTWAGSNGNISIPPDFVDVESGDYALSPESPCIDRGIDLGSPYEGTAPDMGAYESTQPSPPPYPSPCKVVVGVGGDFETLTEALSYCSIPGSTITVLPGQYDAVSGEVFPIPLGDVAIVGEGIPENIVIEGDQIHAVFSCSQSSGFTLENLTITEGLTGVRSELCTGAIVNCRFTNNHTVYPNYLVDNATLYARESSLQIRDSTFLSNEAYTGSVIKMEHESTAEFDRCVLIGNESIEGNCLSVTDNSELTLTRTIVSENRSMQGMGAALSVISSVASLTNCTMTRNYSDLVGGIAVVDGELSLVNSIVWGNMDDVSVDSDSTVTYDHCNIGNSESVAGEGNIAYPPFFDPRTPGSMALSEDSPCVDRGVDVGFPFEGSAPDMGAVESSFLGPNELPVIRHVTVGAESEFRTITQALNQVNMPGSAVTVEPGEYSESAGEDFPLILYGCTIKAQRFSPIDSQPVLTTDEEDCLIYSNFDGSYMLTGFVFTRAEFGAVLLRGSSPIIDQCRFLSNHRDAKGAALICTNNSDPVVSNSVLMNNSSQEGGAGVYLSSGSDAIFVNCLIAENFTSQDGAGLYIVDSAPEFRNCTVAYNDALNSGSAMYGFNSDVLIIDSIVHCNVRTQDSGHGFIISVSYSDTQNWLCEGCILDNPRFIGRPGNRYCLSSVSSGQNTESPCFDAGHTISSDICTETLHGELCLDSMTTRGDRISDSGTVDMGYHYMISDIATPTPVPPPVPAQTTPGILLLAVVLGIVVLLSKYKT